MIEWLGAAISGWSVWLVAGVAIVICVAGGIALFYWSLAEGSLGLGAGPKEMPTLRRKKKHAKK